MAISFSFPNPKELFNKKSCFKLLFVILIVLLVRSILDTVNAVMESKVNVKPLPNIQQSIFYSINVIFGFIFLEYIVGTFCYNGYMGASWFIVSLQVISLILYIVFTSWNIINYILTGEYNMAKQLNNMNLNKT